MDNTDLIAKLRSAGGDGDAIHCWNMCMKAADALETAQAEDPLQGAVDWFLFADRQFFCVATVQRTLRIGYNRAQRLCEIARERAYGKDKCATP